MQNGSALTVMLGQQYVVDAEQFAVKDLQRRGDDLYIISAQQPDKPSIILTQFFRPPKEGLEPPKLLLQDPASGVANDVMIHPKSSVFQWQGDPLPIAVAGSLYAYYFQLEGPYAEHFVLSAASENGTLPAWLSFAHLGGPLIIDLSQPSAAFFNVNGAGPDPDNFLGNNVTIVPDANGDGLDDIVLGAPFAGGSNGAVYVVYGANFSNDITQMGTDGNDALTGTAGVDVLYGGAGGDVINGLAGNDYINSGEGIDIINAGSGNDTIIYSLNDIVVNGGADFDTLWIKSDANQIDFRGGGTIFAGIDELNLNPQRTINGNTVTLNADAVLAMSDANHLLINGNASSVVNLSALDNWTTSAVISGYTTYTSATGSVVDIQDSVHVNLPVLLLDNALDGTNGFFIANSSTGNPSGLFGETIAVVHNAVGGGFDYLFINGPLAGSGYTGEAYLVPGSTAVQPPSLTVDDASLNTITINSLTSNGPFFSIASLGGYTAPGFNNLAFVLGGGSPFAYVLLDPITGLSSSQDIATLNTISLSNGPFN